VKLNIEVERAAEALDQRRRAAPRAGALDARLIRQPFCDHAMHDPQHRADGFGLAGEQEAQRHRKTQHPLPHRPRAEHPFRQVTRTLRHAPRTAAGAKAALVAGERQQPLLRASLPYALRASLRLFKFAPHEFVGMALLARHAQEAVVQHAAAQERPELLARIPNQRAIFCRKTRNEIRVVRLHPRLQQRALGRMPRAGRRRRQRGRRPGGARRCATLQCGEVQHETLLCSDGCTVFRAA